jgi:hypothetical protein
LITLIIYHSTDQLYFSFRQVAIKCQYRDAAGVFKNCINTELNSQSPFLTLSRDECNQLGTIDAIITYKACIDNDEDFIPNKTENAIRFRGEENVAPSNWDNRIYANRCRIYQLTKTIDLCQGKTAIDIEMVGALAKPFPNFCRCYLYKEASINLITEAPTAYHTVYPSASPTVTAKPTINPTLNDCEIYFTEFAYPENQINTGYIEIKAACPGRLIKGIDVITRRGSNLLKKLPLNIVVPNDGFIIICVDKQTFADTFRKNCDIEEPSVFPEGKYPIALVNPYLDEFLLDVYGYVYKDLPNDLIYENGRAVRDVSHNQSSSTHFNPALWHIIPGEGTDKVSINGVDPRIWVNPPV